MNDNDQKIRRKPTHDIQEHWTAVSTLLGLISSVYVHLFPCPWDIILTRMRISKLLGKTWPWQNDHFLRKEYGCNLQDTFRLFGRAVTMTSWVRFKLWLSCRLSALWSLVRSPVVEIMFNFIIIYFLVNIEIVGLISSSLVHNVSTDASSCPFAMSLSFNSLMRMSEIFFFNHRAYTVLFFCFL